MSSGLAGTYFTLLQQFDQKAIPEPTGDNTQIQKVAAPTDSATVSDTSLITTTIQTPPFKYGIARYGQAQYGAMYQNVILADKPVAYYRMDERAFREVLDWSGNGNNGTINGGVTLGQPGAIADGDTAMEFDGSSGYISANIPTLPQGNSPYSFEAWINPDGKFAGNNGPGIGMWGSATNYEDNAFRMNSAASGIQNYWWFEDLIVSTNSLVNVWHHTVFKYDGTTRTIYLDGTEIAFDTPSTAHDIVGTTLFIGWTANGTEYWSGLLDEVAIYNYALSADQVQRHYNAAAWK